MNPTREEAAVLAAELIRVHCNVTVRQVDGAADEVEMTASGARAAEIVEAHMGWLDGDGRVRMRDIHARRISAEPIAAKPDHHPAAYRSLLKRPSPVGPKLDPDWITPL